MYTEDQKRKINQYRKEHPNCKTCVFWNTQWENGQVWDRCDLKNKKIYINYALRCEYYEVREE